MIQHQNTYSYTLRFNKDATLDCQALDKITQFCEITHMSKHAAMMFMLATTDVSALHKSILSLTVTAEEQNIEEDNKRNEPVYEKQQEEQEKATKKNLEEEKDDDLYSNPRFREIFGH